VNAVNLVLAGGKFLVTVNQVFFEGSNKPLDRLSCELYKVYSWSVIWVQGGTGGPVNTMRKTKSAKKATGGISKKCGADQKGIGE
jgi:hypothetical protein